MNSHIQDIGWQGFVSQGELSGTVGQSKRNRSYSVPDRRKRRIDTTNLDSI